MASGPDIEQPHREEPATPQATLEQLVALAVRHVGEQLVAVASNLTNALLDLTAPDEARQVYQRVKSGNLLKQNSYAFVHIAATGIERALRHEAEQLLPSVKQAAETSLDALSLVPMEEMDSKVAFGVISRPFDIAHAEALATLNVRMAYLLDREILRPGQNPFRPDVFLTELDRAWREFEPDEGAHSLIQPLLQPEIVFDFGPMYEALNAALKRNGRQPASAHKRQIRKTDDAAAAKAARASNQAALAKQLRNFFGDQASAELAVPLIPDLPDMPQGKGSWRPSAAGDFVLPVTAGVEQAPQRAPALAPVLQNGAAQPAASLAPSLTGSPAIAQDSRLATAAGVPASAGAGFSAAARSDAPHLHAAGLLAAPQADHGARDGAHGAPFPAGAAYPAAGHTAHAAAGQSPAPWIPPAPGSAMQPSTFRATSAPGSSTQPAAGFVNASHDGMLAVGALELPPGVLPAPSMSYPGFGAQDGAISVPAHVAPLLDLLARIPDLPAAPASAAPAAANAPVDPQNVFYLPRLKQSLPRGSLSRGDESTLDLLSRIFETVFLDQAIPAPTRELIQSLQMPVLKAALVDKNFFFEEAHPARRMIDLLSRMGWDQRSDPDDPLFQAMQRSITRVERDGASQPEVFAEAVAELEQSIAAEDEARQADLAQPVAFALRQERIALARRAASDAVALRLGGDDIVPVVGTFLENKWRDVLTLAYDVEEKKPGAVNNATRAMDDLVWSVKPKATQEQRKALIARLPSLLTTINKWLDIIKWQDAERLQFFAALAECHASIVRAPIDLSPQRQLELAVEAAQQDALRLVALERAAAERAELEAGDAVTQTVEGLERGRWLEFTQEDGSLRKLKLVWVSPRRTLFIFSAGARQEAFSMPAEQLANAVREGKASILALEGVVGRVLSEAMLEAAGNDASVDAAA